MKVHSPSEVAKQLEVKESTLRKYSILLENAGMTFQRNSQNQRWYSDSDVMALRKLVTLKNNGDMSLKECANAVYHWTKGNDITQPLTVAENDIQRNNADITELKSMVHKQNELIGHLAKRLDEQQEYLDKRLNERDHALMQALQQSLESQKQIAATQKKSIWGRLFKRQ